MVVEITVSSNLGHRVTDVRKSDEDEENTPSNTDVRTREKEFNSGSISGDFDGPTTLPSSKLTRSVGRKSALCIGLSYEGKDYELPGCHKDATRFAAALKTYSGYTDAKLILNEHATVRNVEAALRQHFSYARTAEYDEVCCFFSGHGYQVKERVAGSEANGKDQVIICSDGFIRDDTINNIILSCHPSCHVVCVFDCCTSGTVSDLPYMDQSNFHGGSGPSIICVAAAEDGKTALQLGGEGVLTKFLIKNVLRRSTSLKKIHGKKLKRHQKIVVTGANNPRGTEEIFW